MRRIHRSERIFSESFFHVLNGWSFLYQGRPQCDPKKPFSDSSKRVLMDCSTKHKCNSVRWIHTSPRSFWENFFLVFICGYFLCHRQVHCDMKNQIADLQNTVLTKLITAEKRVTLWVALTHRNAVSLKGSFQCWSQDISFFTIALHELPTITLQNPRQQC